MGVNFLEEFFGRNFLEEFFRRIFLGGFFLGGFFWEDFLGGFFGEEFFVYIGFSTFCLNNEGRRSRNLDPDKCDASSLHLKSPKKLLMN